jgi:hypothetical protein
VGKASAERPKKLTLPPFFLLHLTVALLPFPSAPLTFSLAFSLLSTPSPFSLTPPCLPSRAASLPSPLSPSPSPPSPLPPLSRVRHSPFL